MTSFGTSTSLSGHGHSSSNKNPVTLCVYLRQGIRSHFHLIRQRNPPQNCILRLELEKQEAIIFSYLKFVRNCHNVIPTYVNALTACTRKFVWIAIRKRQRMTFA